MSVVAAVTRDLDLIRSRAPELADSALGASALVLAAELDNAGNSATSKSMCAKALFEVMEQLRALAPPPAKEADGIDDLASKREARRATVGSAGTTDTARS